MARYRLPLPALAALIAVPLILLPLTTSAAVPPPPAGWTTVFSDDFTGAAGSGVNTANWQYTTGTSYPGGPANFGTGEVESMSASTNNVSLDGNGDLRITPQRDGAGNWTSGRIETKRSDFEAPAGGTLRAEARIQMPNVTGNAARGYWPAFWLLGAPYRGNWWNWPGIGELDIMENVQGINNNWSTMHCGTSPGGPCNETTGIGGQMACTGSTCQGGFHTYALEWDRSTNPEQMRFYLDGVNFHTVRSNQVDAGTWAAATNHGFFMILNVAMGGQFPAALGGGPDGNTSPGHPMLVDYVSIMQRNGGTPPPPPPPTCGPLVSQGKTATSSAVESANLGPQYAVDGNLATRWSSAFSDPQWITVDLGSVQPITRVKLTWEAAYATAYSLQVSNDNANWTTAYSTATGAGGVEDLAVTATGRYVRLYGTQRATPYGYSLWEFQIYGACTGTTTTPPPTTTTGGTPPPPGNRDAYSQIQAESADMVTGPSPEATSDTGGGQDLANATAGMWLYYKGVDFGPTAATQFDGRVASGAAGGVSGLVEVHLDSASNPPIGSFSVANTGGWQAWKTVPANITGATGTHDVFLTFSSGQSAPFVSLNWFYFGH